MTKRPWLRQASLRAAIILTGWTAVGLFAVAQSYASTIARGRVPTVGPVMWIPVASTTIWALLTPPIWWLARRFPFATSGRGAATAVAVHSLGCLVVGLVDVAADQIVTPALFGIRILPFWPYFTSDLWLNVFSYFALVAVIQAIEYGRLYRREREARAALSHRLALAQLEALRAHLHPHFIFNAINVAAELVHEDPVAADHFLTRLGTLLQRAYSENHALLVTLEEELAFSRDYLEVMAIRFDGRLDVSMDVRGDAARALVPGFVLQPLLENAVRHGIEPHPGGGAISVAAHRDGGSLIVSVSNTGADMAETTSDGHGMQLTRGLLGQAFGDGYQLRMTRRPEGGTEVLIHVPLLWSHPHRETQQPAGVGGSGRLNLP